MGGSVCLGLVKLGSMLSGQGSERCLCHREAPGAGGKPSPSVSHGIPCARGSPRPHCRDTGRLWVNGVRDGLKIDGTKTKPKVEVARTSAMVEW